MTVDIDTGDHDLFGHRAIRRHRVAQLALPLGWCRDNQTDAAGEILVGSSNELAARHIQTVEQWVSPATILVGPRGSGKSAFARMFLNAGAGEVIDGLAGADEADVFHAWNRAQSGSGRLLITATSDAEVAAVSLPDLRTRLASAPIVAIGDPDLCLTAALIERLLAQRGYAPTPQIAGYAAERIARTYAAIHALIDAVDSRAMAGGRILSVRLMRDAIGDLSPRAEAAAVSADGGKP